MIADNRTETGSRPLAGRTILSARALQHLAVGVARDAARVSAKDVSVTLADHEGALIASVTVPVVFGPVANQSLDVQGAHLRRAMIAGLEDYAGRRVTSVNVRFSGVRNIKERRVS